MMKYLNTLYDFLNKILIILSGVSVMALMLLATGNVVLRIIGVPFRGAYEVVSFLGAVVIAFALATTQQTKSNIVVDILTEKYPKELRLVVDKMADIIMVVFFGIACWQIYVWGIKIYESREVSETLKLPFYPFVFAVAIGFAMLSFTAFVDFLKKLLREEE